MSLFRSHKPAEVEATLPVGEMAWSEGSSIYSSKDFPKYNPDSLIGKKGHGIYRRMMQDEQVKAVVKFKRDAITSRDYMFVLDADLPDEEREFRIALSQAVLNKMHGSPLDAFNGIMTGMWHGFSMTELVFSQFDFEGATYWGVDKLKLRPFDTFEFYPDEHGNLLKVVQRVDNKEQEIDLNRFIYYVHNPEEDDHYGYSELRAAYRSFFSKDVCIKFYNMWMERHASGFKWVQPKEGGAIRPGTAEYVALQNVLSDLSAGAGMILPGNVDFQMQFPNNNVAFKEAIDFHNLAIAKALLVPNLMGVTPAGQTGSYSQSGTQLQTFLWTLEADATRLEDVLNEQLFRRLAVLNFGDDNWPRFKFKPINNDQQMEIVSKWKDLVTSGAVRPDEADDRHLRDLMDMPKPTPKEDGGTSPNQSQALNGAQVASLVDVVAKVTSGEVPKTAAIEIIIASFPLNREEAEAMLKDVEEGSRPAQVPAGQQEPSGGTQPGDGGMAPPEGGGDTPDNTGTPAQGATQDDKDTLPDETIIGRVTTTIGHVRYSVDKAVRRVDFKVIERNSEGIEDEYVPRVGRVVALVAKDYIAKLQEAGDADAAVEAIKTTKPSKGIIGKLNRVITASLKEAFKLGTKHAEIEIDRAKGEAFSRRYDKRRVAFIADDYFKIRAFKAAGKLTDDVVAAIEQIILNGSKYGASWSQMESEIYSTLASKGMVDMETARELLADALDVENPDARLRTMIRTNSFEAINEARHAVFTDPELGGFVVGMEYSAILDSRTTEICQHLDNRKYDAQWWEDNARFRPPNHYNCRSILVPITEVDEFVETRGNPRIEPQEGFG